MTFTELTYLFVSTMGNPSEVKQGVARTWEFETAKTDLPLTVTDPALIRSLETGFDCERISPKRKKIRLVKKFSKRYGVRMKIRNVYLKFEAQGVGMDVSGIYLPVR